MRVQDQLADLQATEARINEAVATWRTMSDSAPQEGEFCPLIERGVINPLSPNTPG